MKKKGTTQKIWMVCAGLLTAILASTAYAVPSLKLPYSGGETWWVSQGNFGSYSHGSGTGREYAWDFNFGSGSADLGKPVLAPAAGTVAKIYRNQPGWGNVVVIDYGDGDYGKLAHLQTVLVSENQIVEQGQMIGTCGSTGTTSPHIHYQTQNSDGLDGQSVPSSFSDVSGNGVPEGCDCETEPQGSAYHYTSGNYTAPIVYFQLNETFGTTAEDADQKDSNDGTLYGNAQFVTGCIEGNCVEFDGSADYIEIADADELDFSASMTVQAWVWFAGNHSGQASDSEIVAAKYGNGNAYLLYRDGVDGKLKFSIGESDCSTTHTAASGDVLSGGVWYHVAGVYDQAAGTLKTYVGGVQSGSSISYNGSVCVSTDPVRLGGNYSNWDLDGKVDEVKLYDYARSDAQIGASARSCVLDLALDENGGSVAGDSSPHGNDGSISGANWVSGKYGYALDFDGNDDYVTIPHTPIFLFDQGFTIEAWIKGSGANFSSNSRVSASGNIYYPELQVVGNKIYYVWQQQSGSYTQIWTASMDTIGTNWSASQRTSDSWNKYEVHQQVVGSKIYYVWRQQESSGRQRWQIWTGVMNTDGSGWTATQRTSGGENKLYPRLQVAGSKIYYVYVEDTYNNSNDWLWTAEMNIDGTGWSASVRDSARTKRYGTDLYVSGSKIYYVWSEQVSSYFQIMTASLNTDGSGWSGKDQHTFDNAYNMYPRLQVVNGKIYYTWSNNNNYFQIMTASLNTDGSSWSAAQRTNDTFYNAHPQLQVLGGKIYYTWYSYGSNQNIWTAEMNTDGSGWTKTQRTSGSNKKQYPQLQADGSRFYYVWIETDASYYRHVYTGQIGSNATAKASSFGFGVDYDNNRVTGFLNAERTDLGGAVSTTLDPAAWTHIAVTYDKDNLILYKDGSYITGMSLSEEIVPNSFALRVGDGFDGAIDEIRIFNYARTASQVAVDAQ